MAWRHGNDEGTGEKADDGDAHGYTELPVAANDGHMRMTEKWLRTALDSAINAQRAPAQAYVRHLRASKPNESPARIERRLDANFVRLVGSAGTAAGATAMVPGIGTVLSIGAISADAVAFLEAVTFHTLAKAMIHGVDISRRDQRELLVSIILLGSTGNAIVERAANGRKGRSVAQTATQLPDLGRVNNFVVKRLVRTFVYKRFKGSLVKFLPAGIGAVLGGWGNYKAGKAMVARSNEAFGPAPATWPHTRELEAPRRS